MTSEPENADEGKHILVCAPFGRDAESVADLLERERHTVTVCPDLGSVAAAIGEQIGTVLLTDEALAGDVPALQKALAGQPRWSDLPFILLEAEHSRTGRNREVQRVLLSDITTNIVVLERPMRIASLVSTVAAALRSRQKQFEVRDRIADLAESESRLRLATEAAEIGTWDFNPVTQELMWDERCKAMFGLAADAPVTYAQTFVAGIHPDDRAAAEASVAAALDPTGEGQFAMEYRTLGLGDGVERCLAASGRAIFDDGVAVRFIGTTRDVSDRRKSETLLARSQAELRAKGEALEALNRTLEERVAQRTAALEAEMQNRGQIEEALRQSQKMEAVGQLTGGIAHDFNNMLTGVIGGIDIAKRRIAAGRLDDVDRFMDAASTSATRAAALTARLLAFSRRQSLDARAIDVNALVASLDDLLRRSINETIDLRVVASDTLPHAMVDANQLENAILNLAINARDAMPDGGSLTVELSAIQLGEADVFARPELKAGRYVVVAVSDTGVGMSADVVAKVFEPFFTTKPVGAGTGLGLSMVYGFAKQSGGQVRVHSQPGSGTSVKIFLPAVEAATSVASAPSPPAQEGAGQTVLFVEDDPSVRILICSVLEELSYRAIEAADATFALPILQSDQHIDLLISDVGLPGMNGRQLAEIARQHRPTLPILFVTGYTENAAIRAGFLGTNMDMITKPFALDELGAKIAEMVPSPVDA